MQAAPRPLRSLGGGDPTKLYEREVFVWLPHLLPGAPNKFHCPCGMHLSRNGNFSNLHRSMPADFFLLTNRFICDPERTNSPGCGKHYQGIDPHILTQLPRFVQEAFPAYISARGAVSKPMMWQMSNTFATRFGAAPFAELVSGIQHRFHAETELIWPLQISMFHKYAGGLKGQPIFTAAYTVVNEFEEVRAHSLTSTKSLSFVKDLLEGIQQGLKDSNHPPTQIVYTDSPQIIEERANDILIDVANEAPHSPLYIIAAAIKVEQQPGKAPRLDLIQLRTRNQIYVFKKGTELAAHSAGQEYDTNPFTTLLSRLTSEFYEAYIHWIPTDSDGIS
ncbi:hypothetical protein B0H14DRAFT_3146115 [Mycena olivaceomarginata]|nr:hypothetical protein B0H14DRAFT_3146115 [Mycena olivaceomarginata]